MEKRIRPALMRCLYFDAVTFLKAIWQYLLVIAFFMLVIKLIATKDRIFGSSSENRICPLLSPITPQIWMKSRSRRDIICDRTERANPAQLKMLRITANVKLSLIVTNIDRINKIGNVGRDIITLITTPMILSAQGLA